MTGTAKATVPTPEEARWRNVVDMALGFTATMRVFEAGSKTLIASLLAEHLREAQRCDSREAFELVHEAFCWQFVRQVRLAARRRKGASTKPAVPASYGHAAKMFDVCTKVWFYYCQLPDAKTASRVTPYLHAAIDTPILNRLKKLSDHAVKAVTLGDIDRAAYLELQTLAARDRAATFPGAALMVHYDDLVWSKLSRKGT